MSSLVQNTNVAVSAAPAPAVGGPGMGETTSITATTVTAPQQTASAVEAAALKGPDEAGTSNTEEAAVAKHKAIEVLIAERTAKRAQKKAAEQQLAEGHRRAGDVLMESKNYKAAVAQYQEALNLCRNNVKYYLCLASAYRKLAWYEEAAHNATQALILDPKNAEARYIRGVARLEQRLLTPAKLDFEVVLQHEPTHFLARAALTEVTAFIGSSAAVAASQVPSESVENASQPVDFTFPPLDYDPLEIASVSDSSDCNHVGNGVPCRFYNHDGCSRGTLCTFSHAPDEKSVRDELGRNVCIYHLLSSCKFGAAKCVYSHSKIALPKRGWWTSPEKIAKVKAVMEVTERKVKESRANEAEMWKAYVKGLKADRAKKGKKDTKTNGDANANGNVKTVTPSPPNSATTMNGEKGRKAAQAKKVTKTGKGQITNGKGQAAAVDNALSQAQPERTTAVAEIATTVVPTAPTSVIDPATTTKETTGGVQQYLDEYYAVRPKSASEYLNAYYKVVV
ncbi:hypothetical protein CVT24_008851 [Panaeolus cyanescens]|uniref:C3H1-type domain-containing protein n=1 Tax=Panaeolus cyanescens TaxID=181874 RepID=A0A409VAV6_9AGAR|nr:hypothetical protein CVT24_008851 [Panaeolus cyanescens]